MNSPQEASFQTIMGFLVGPIAHQELNRIHNTSLGEMQFRRFTEPSTIHQQVNFGIAEATILHEFESFVIIREEPCRTTMKPVNFNQQTNRREYSLEILFLRVVYLRNILNLLRIRWFDMLAVLLDGVYGLVE